MLKNRSEPNFDNEIYLNSLTRARFVHNNPAGTTTGSWDWLTRILSPPLMNVLHPETVFPFLFRLYFDSCVDYVIMVISDVTLY